MSDEMVQIEAELAEVRAKIAEFLKDIGMNNFKLLSLYKVLDQIIDYRGQSVPKADNGIPLITAKNVKEGTLDFSERESIAESQYQTWMTRGIPKKGDIVFTTEAPLGNAAPFPDNGKYAIGQRIVALRPKIDVLDSGYLLQFLLSPVGKKRILRMSSGSTAKGIKSSELKKIKIETPSIKLQEFIGALLTSWDTAIEKTERLIAEKEVAKKGLMQRLLFGKVRFGGRKNGESKEGKWFSIPSDWKRVKIGAIAKEISKKNSNGDTLPVLSCTKYQGLVNSLEYFDKQIFSIDTSTYKIVESRQFAYATNHIEEGSIGYQDLYPKGLISPMYTVFKADPNKINDGYLYKLLKTETFRRIFAINTNASVDRRGSLRWKDFSKLPIPLPSVPEQQEINQVLDTAQQEITLLQKKLDLLKTQKRGLMQKLLTGQWRVDALINEKGNNDEQGNWKKTSPDV